MRRLTPTLSRYSAGILWLAIFVYGCGRGGGMSEEMGLPKGWRRHGDPQGFVVHLPPQWNAQRDDRTGRVTVTGPEDVRLHIWPVFVPAALTPATAGAVLDKLARRVEPEARWGRPEAVAPAAVRARGRAGDRAAVAVFRWVGTPQGTGGFLYAAGAETKRLRELEETIAEVFDSFRVTGPPVEKPRVAARPAVRYARWEDPREQAFSLEVPRDWKVEGGLFRFASVDTRVGVVVTSPDGKIRLTCGDADLPTFTEPSPMLMMAGLREGSWYSPGCGVNMMVRRYTPGTAFVREYVASRAAKGLEDVRITAERDRPDAVEAINQVYQQYGQLGMYVKMTAGEVVFAGRQNDRPWEGYYFCATRAVQPAGGAGALWNAEYLYGYLCAAEQKPLAETVLAHMVGTFELNPRWVAMQQNIAADTSKIVSRTHEEIASMIQRSYEERQQSLDEISRRRSNAILGVEDVVDPLTGRELKVESGSNYYWIDHRGLIVGTETDTRPNLDFRELVRLP